MKTLVSTIIFCAGLGLVSEAVVSPETDAIWHATLDQGSTSGIFTAEATTNAAPPKNIIQRSSQRPTIQTVSDNTKPSPTLTVNAGEALAIRKMVALKKDLAKPKSNLITKTIKIGRGETLVDVVANTGASRKDTLMAIRALKGSVNPRRIKAGQKIFVTLSKENNKIKLQDLGLELDFNTIVTATIQPNGSFKKSQKAIPTITLRQVRFGTIDDSLYLAAEKNNVPIPVLTDMIRIFSYDVDFQREIRKGDSFKLYFERKMREDTGQIQEGKVLFAELILRGKPMGFYNFSGNKKSSADYFDSNGRSAQKALMKTPVDGARLSSNFGRRKHPILGYTKMHTGVDFGARRGTPVMAAGDGIIEKSGRNGVYGNYIRIRHNSTYKTAYGHLNGYAKGIRAGRRVKQGQIIGYVGNTGRSTAPHLHYEVFVNGRVSNPLRLKFPTGVKLKKKAMTAFNIRKLSLDDEMDRIQEKALMAGLVHDGPLVAKNPIKTDEEF